jgi:hypothetical protein
MASTLSLGDGVRRDSIPADEITPCICNIARIGASGRRQLITCGVIPTVDQVRLNLAEALLLGVTFLCSYLLRLLCLLPCNLSRLQFGGALSLRLF